MPSNFTENYNLSQWARTDKVQMEDFNADNAKIDGALAKQSADTAAALALKGNCKIWTYSYTGTGKYGSSNPTKITFPGVPAATMIFGANGTLFTLMPGQSMGLFHTQRDGSYRETFSWSGNVLTLTSSNAEGQMNYTTQYLVLALYQL